ncbi:DUF7694 domain-containing protein [Alicyclobacillus vulcanalis]|uniref:DUF7694 domain-containing protein n=1 Tax=Alicyclobacillus vulcanalis TaxID=252246 RepID=A0A1N7MRK2_9BACL|nr:hypothetical protein [Alicyclobacillus vulcanalis]SIS88764.1 hypothetical protein SAMN05421799_10659 [Alicyclobacillus vulcanalis]
MKAVHVGEAWHGCKVYKLRKCTVMVEYHVDGGWHMSISHPERYPTWDEIREARYQLIPNDVTMAMLLPPKEEYVNVHPNCFHLHEVVDNGSDIPMMLEAKA